MTSTRQLAIVSLLVGLFTVTAAMADGPIYLKARSGEGINIWYGSQYFCDGNSASSNISGIHVAVDNGIPGITRVVLVNNCMPSNDYASKPTQTIYNCSYGSDGAWVNPQNCSVQGDNGYYSDSIVNWWANHSVEVNCSQQIAVSLTRNQWLVDPVSGQHNFNFSFPRAVYR